MKVILIYKLLIKKFIHPIISEFELYLRAYFYLIFPTFSKIHLICSDTIPKRLKNYQPLPLLEGIT